MKHTTGKLKVIPQEAGYENITISGPAPDPEKKARYMPIATVHEYQNGVYPLWYEVNEEEQNANATRIVACWNACEGIENPEVVPEMIKVLRAAAQELYHLMSEAGEDPKPETCQSLKEELLMIKKKNNGLMLEVLALKAML